MGQDHIDQRISGIKSFIADSVRAPDLYRDLVVSAVGGLSGTTYDDDEWNPPDAIATHAIAIADAVINELLKERQPQEAI